MTIKIANGAGFLGDNLDAPRLLVESAQVDYLTLEYLAELTMSILARQREKNPAAGYAADFLDVLKSLIPALKAQPQLKIVTNAGGVNPSACAAAAGEILQAAGLGDTAIGVVSGDDLLPRLAELQSSGCDFKNLDTGEPLEKLRQKIVSANAYLGARPIAEALAGRSTNRHHGPRGRCFAHGRAGDARIQTELGRLELFGGSQRRGTFDRMRRTGDRRTVSTLAKSEPGQCRLSNRGNRRRWIVRDHKAAGNGGTVSRATVIEQLVYEIGDPAHYLTPDVDVDFTTVEVKADGQDRVAVRGATGRPAPENYKVSLAYENGFAASGQLLVYGDDCVEKARACGEMILERVARAGFKLEESLVECLGGGDGVPGQNSFASDSASGNNSASAKEVVLRVSVHDARREAVERFAKEFAPLITSGPPGLAGYAVGRPQVRPVFAYWPTLVPKRCVEAKVRG